MTPPLTSKCSGCGANTQLPSDLNAVAMTCEYCGFSAAIPAELARVRALEGDRQRTLALLSQVDTQYEANKVQARRYSFGIYLFVAIVVVLPLVIQHFARH